MRRLSSPHQVFDNSVNSRYELYEDGNMMAYVKYRMQGENIIFLICQASRKPVHDVDPRRVDSAMYRTELLCREAMKDVHRRKLRALVVSRAMKNIFGLPMAAQTPLSSTPATYHAPTTHSRAEIFTQATNQEWVAGH